MKKSADIKPAPKSAVCNPDLVRPNWITGQKRDRTKLWLDKNENTDLTYAEIVKGVLSDIAPEIVCSYPEIAPLYRKLATYLHIDPENLLIATGSDGVIRAVFEAYISDGDTILHTDPTFAMYGVYGSIYGARVKLISYQKSSQGPVLDVSKMISMIGREQPKLICLPNPDSPTGTIVSDINLKLLIEAAASIGAIMLIDEAYYPFYDQTALNWINQYRNLIVARSTGKAWGLAGFRIGYAAAASELTAILHKVKPMYETDNVAVAVFERMLDFEVEMLQSVVRLENGKRHFLEHMAELDFDTLQGYGNFLYVAFKEHAENVHQALEDKVYYRKNFSHPCLNGYSRFSAATIKSFDPLITAIRSASTTI